MPDDLTLLLWATLGFVALLFLLLVGLFVGGWWLIVWPAVTEAKRARAAGDWWLPFLPRPDGSWSPLVDSPKRAAMRAVEPGGRLGLVVRWGFWACVAIVLTGAVVAVLVLAVVAFLSLL